MIFDSTPLQKSNFEKNKEIEEQNEEEEKRVDTINDLEKGVREASPKTEVLDIHTNPNLLLLTLSLCDLPPNVAAEIRRQISSTQIMIEHEGTKAMLRKPKFRNQDAELKIAIKIACLVISVSATAIVSFLVESLNQQTVPTITTRLLLKAGLLLMFASFLLALVLLIVSLAHLNFSCLILVVRGIMWASAGLMTFSLLLLLIYYLQVS